MSVYLLAIESSCDDTAAAILQDGKILSNVVASQLVHEQYGGVVPEVASRAHQTQILPVVQTALDKAGIQVQQLNGVAFTRGPGLIGSLLVGVSFAKGLALALDLPLLEVHHMEAHILAHFAAPPAPAFPFLCLTVSGGHTQIVLVKNYFELQVLGETIDDAAGEAFDKAGKLMGLPYPAGPHVDRLAQDGQARFLFPEPRIPGFDFSFSGLKTSFLYFLQEQVKQQPNFIEQNLPDLCASIQNRIITILLHKLESAALELGITRLGIAGGVSANSGLRSGLRKLCDQHHWEAFIPAFEYCTDNAGMIAVAAYQKYLSGKFSHQEVTPEARMPMPRWEGFK
jgi:N6-L-threonylcarbamoyladenine synthase